MGRVTSLSSCTTEIPLKDIQSLIKDEWYKAVIQSATEGFFLADTKGNILDVNDAFCIMHGCSREELLNTKIQDIDVGFIEGSKNYTQEVLEVKRAGGKSGGVRHRCKDGRIIDVLVSVKYLNAGPGFIFCFHRDITEQKKICKQLKESEERYRSLIELGSKIGEAVVMLQDVDDKEGIQTFVSDSWLNITGYPREELLGMPFFDLLSPGHRKDSIERHRRKLNGENIPQHFEMFITRKDGREIPIEVTSGYSTYQGKKANVAYIRDITERKQAEEKLRESKAFTESLIISMKDGFSLLDNRGVHLNVNDAFCQMTSFTREELIGTGPPHPYWPEEEYERIQATFQKTLKGDFENFELIFKRKNDERFPVIVSPSWLKDKDGNVISYFATVKDVTNLKDMQEQVIKAASQAIAARDSEKMKTELLSMVSHELRTPLASIKGFASTLLQPDVRWSEDEKWDFIREINTEADRLSHLVDDLLDMSSIEAGTLSLNKARCSISKTLEEAKPMLAKIAKQNGLKVEAADKLPLVIIDKERIMQVLSNLVDNAVKFSPMGSQITIEAKKSQGKVFVSVTDQGIGIPVAAQSKLFDRFYQAKKITYGAKRGTGLGLAICKGLVEAHGGKIWLDSHEGRGSTFYFSLPICRSD